MNLGSNVVRHILSNVRAGLEGTESERRTASRIRSDELSLSLVPEVEQLLRRSGTDQSWVSNTAESHSRNVSGRGVDSFEVPDGLGGLGLEVLCEETCEKPNRVSDWRTKGGTVRTSSVFELKDTRVSPRLRGKGLNIEDFDEERISGPAASQFR